MNLLDQIYETGTVTVTTGSKVITGSGTGWLLALVEGGLIEIDGAGLGAVRLASVGSDTDGLLKFDWQGPTLVGAAYTIYRETAQAAAAFEANAHLADIARRLRAGTFLQPDATGTLAERAAHDDQDQGFVFIQSDVTPFRIFIKESSATGDWSNYTVLQGDKGDTGSAAALVWITGGWAAATDYEVNNGLAHNGTSYRCHAAHTSAAATEPGVGASWQDVWETAAAKGNTGDKGWAVEPELVADGSRRVLRIADYLGGEGAKPPGTGLYIGADGLTANLAEALDIRGATGPQGARGITWRGDWNAVDTYPIGHVVTDNDALGDPAAWIAIADNTNARPRDNPASWEFFPASFPASVDYGDFSAPATDFTDYGDFS